MNIDTSHIDFSELAGNLSTSEDEAEKYVERAARDQKELCAACAENLHDKPVGALTWELSNPHRYAIFLLCVSCSRKAKTHEDEIGNNIRQRVRSLREAHGFFGSNKVGWKPK